jgi:NifU-like protein involved in Fe-S cluster formation
MDQAVIQYYRKLLKEGFTHAGSLDNPSIMLDSVGEKIRICGHAGRNYVHIFINVSGDRIEEIKYLCTCDPTANVVVELLCILIKDKTLGDAKALSTDDFLNELESEGREFLRSVEGIIELLHKGIQRYQKRT